MEMSLTQEDFTAAEVEENRRLTEQITAYTQQRLVVVSAELMKTKATLDSALAEVSLLKTQIAADEEAKAVLERNPDVGTGDDNGPSSD